MVYDGDVGIELIERFPVAENKDNWGDDEPSVHFGNHEGTSCIQCGKFDGDHTADCVKNN